MRAKFMSARRSGVSFLTGVLAASLSPKCAIASSAATEPPATRAKKRR